MSDLQSNCDNNMVNLYRSQLKEIDLDGKIQQSREQLDQWLEQSRQLLDEYYKQKLDQFNTYVEQIRSQYAEKSAMIERNISELNEKNKDVGIRCIEQDLKVLQGITLPIHFQPLIIDENSVQIEKDFNFQTIQPTNSIFQYSNESSSAIASNERYLLMHQHPYLSLIDHDCKITRQTLWNNDWIRDMCWSTKLRFFILITANNIFFVNEKLESCLPLQDHLKQKWFSCTCSEEFLYISTCQWGSSIFQLSLSTPVDLIKEWTSPTTCENNQGIHDIKYCNQTIAISIKDPKEHHRGLVLKSAETFNTIWSYSLIASPSIRLFTCCPINAHEWLIIDGASQKIFQITQDGKLKNDGNYPHVPYRANLFHSTVLAISAEVDLRFYRIFT